MEKLTQLATAKVGKVFGVEGYLRIYPFSGEYSHLLKLDKAELELMSKERISVTVMDSKMHQGFLLMRFSEYKERERAKALSGSVMYIERSKCPPLKKGEYYVADLYGCSLIYDGNEVGKVVGTFDGPQALLLEVETNDKRKVLIPNMKPFVDRIDVSKGSINLLMKEVLE